MSNEDNNINPLYGLLGLVTAQIILRTVGIENISAQIFDTAIIIVCTLTSFSLYKNRKKGFGIKYNITVAILMIVMCITMCILITMIKCYPIQADEHSTLLLILSLGGFFSFTIYIIAARIYFEYKKNKKYK